MAADLTRVRLERGSLKGRVTSFKSYVDGIDTTATLAPANLRELNRRYCVLEDVLEKYYTKHNEVLLLIEADDIENEEAKKVEFEDDYFELMARASALIDNSTALQSIANHSGSSSGASASSGGSSRTENVTHIQLPKISLPSFAGVHETWLEFRDKFLSLIHTNPTVADMDKFHYLQSCLVGEASHVIGGLDFTADNYKEAWDLVCARYNNPRILVHNHIRALFSIEPIHKESAGKLRGMLDNLSKNINALEQLKQPDATLFDTLIIYIITSKFDHETARNWEQHEAEKLQSVPTLKDLKTFMRNKADLLSSLELKRASEKSNININKHVSKYHSMSNRQPVNVHVANTNVSIKCVICKSEHFIRQCPEFLKLSPTERYTKIKSLNRCVNCFRFGHAAFDCNGGTCRHCNKKHNTLLHFETNFATENKSDKINSSENKLMGDVEKSGNYAATTSALISSNAAQISCKNSSYVLLSTVKVVIYDKYNKGHTVRLMLDNGSQSNFITQELANKLQLNMSPTDMEVTGIFQVSSSLSSCCQAKIKSIHSNFTLKTNYLVTSAITTPVPSVRINRESLNIPSNLLLADPQFHEIGKVDMLIGAEHFFSLLCIGQVATYPKGPLLQKTKFGWIISGMAAGQPPKRAQTSCNLIQTTNNADFSLSKFWEIEEIPEPHPRSLSDTEVEEYFKLTTIRNSDGKFVVKMPINNISELGDTKELAFQRFLRLERKLQQQPQTKLLYDSFMKEYLGLKHMSLSNDSSVVSYYLPHHCVVNESSSTTKLRVVFDGSARPLDGKSLNQCLPVGPTLQDDLFSILVRFRTYAYVVGADVEKMYRQVLLDPSQTSLQRIFWRPNPDSPVNSYDLQTVTYGTTLASYLAIRCLLELANDNSLHPSAAKVIRHDFYVDDLLTGSDSIDELRQIITTVDSKLRTAGFKLRKWSTNSDELLVGLHDINNGSLTFGENENLKTLGLFWQPRNDTLHYKINTTFSKIVTKRTVISTICRIFDPLGLLAPVTIVAKSFIQNLWRSGIGWDESLPSQLFSDWIQFHNSLSDLNRVSIPRNAFSKNGVSLEIHGFSDASEKAYAACIYIRSMDSIGHVTSSLFCSKAKVAPLKTLTIPRLELCGALLLAQLLSKVLESAQLKPVSYTMWCDSTIVLAWIKTCPSKLQIFVAHRITKIQNLVEPDCWRYVPTADNPADLASRGIVASQLLNCDLWWQGPKWLSYTPDNWPHNIVAKHNNLELRSKITSLSSNTHTPLIEITKFSSLHKLQITMAYILRFAHNARCKAKSSYQIGPITLEEKQRALRVLVKCQQQLAFGKEIEALSKGKPISSSSKILSLSPLLDSDGILLVGGRLRNSNLPFNAQHQVLLPNSNHLTQLIFQAEHIRLLHIGPLGLLNSMRQKYWPIFGRNNARKVVRECVICFRANPQTIIPEMGQLPKNRVNPAPPFYHTGVDYAGPVILKTMQSRGCKTLKAYIAVFVCLCTKAIHLELVTSLGSEAFIATLKRFVARRGRPCFMYSDNGTNFVGANRELQDLGAFLKNNVPEICNSASKEGIHWKFIPARSPHFGGIWEAGVKSVKHHLRRVNSDQPLTFEDFYTLLVQIEAVLNSRPLTQLSSDPNDLLPLTPAHLLVGRPMSNDIVDMDYTNTPVSRLSRYQHTQKMLEHFWKRWSKDYLNEMQQKTKWKTSPNMDRLRIGALVVLKEDNMPPQRWKMGRIAELHPGKDDIIRVVSVKTATGTVKRATHRICPLPVEAIDAQED